MHKMRFWKRAVIAVGVVFGLAGAPAVLAQDNQVMPGKMIQWGDYDQFQVAGPGGARSCGETCAHDPRCRAWTYIKTVNQCRLKHDVGSVVDNGCCVSGIKSRPVTEDHGGKQAFCADYARQAVAAADQTMRLGCNLHGPRWTDDFQAHFSWCMGTRRDDVARETQARAASLAQCQQTQEADAGAKCDHFARISMVQVETAVRAHCPLPQGDRRWGNNMDDQKQACLQAPARVLEHTIAEREAVLATCLAAAGQAQEACGAYADKAVEQVRAATASACDIGGPSWSSARAQHLQFCLKEGAKAAKAQTDDRARQIADCNQLAARRKTCDQYAEGAVQQAASAETENCGFHGPNWSRYKDEHVAFCLQAGDAQLRSAVAERNDGLKACQTRVAVNPECDDYAKRAVQIAQVNEDKSCANDGEAFSTDYNEQYKYCLGANRYERRFRLERSRQAMVSCSQDHGFTLQFKF